jgi:lipoprotein-anchoring transpeptidase ErfK/SrfK
MPTTCSTPNPARSLGGSRRRRTRAAVAALAVVVGSLGSACASGGGSTAARTTTTAPAVAAPSTSVVDGTSTTAPVSDEAPGAPEALVARSAADLDVLDRPDGAVTRRVAAATEFGSPLALLVTDQAPGWVEVLLPGRPTGAVGWVATEAVELRRVDLEIRVDLAARRLTLVEAGRSVLETSVAIGAPDAPTPTGRFSLTDKIRSADPAGPYGHFALGLSGRSGVLTEFAGGDGQIGIHGTNDPASIGRDVSHGCIRVPNEVIEELAARLPLGTPVVVS